MAKPTKQVSSSRNRLACVHTATLLPDGQQTDHHESVGTSGQAVPFNQTAGDPHHALHWTHSESHFSVLSLLEVTSLRSAMVRLIPASCFQTGSARFRLRGLPVRMAIPSNTPAHSKHRRQDILGADDKVPRPLKHTEEMSSAPGPQCPPNQCCPDSQRLRSVLAALYRTLKCITCFCSYGLSL